jgi:hypothetical protein
MGKLWEDRRHTDLVLGYQQLCRNPAGVVERILREACGRQLDSNLRFPRLRCFDDEYLRGAPLRSKNEIDRLDSIAAEPIELTAFSADEIARIAARCQVIQDRFEILDYDGSD